jgi:hypothetical protein
MCIVIFMLEYGIHAILKQTKILEGILFAESRQVQRLIDVHEVVGADKVGRTVRSEPEIERRKR